MAINNPRAIFFPYCIQRLDDGRYAVLNRNYKPLGFQTTEYLNYADFPIAATFKGLTPKKAAVLSSKGSEDLDAIYLYDDSCIPTASAANMKAYQARLALLAKMQFAK